MVEVLVEMVEGRLAQIDQDQNLSQGNHQNAKMEAALFVPTETLHREEVLVETEASHCVEPYLQYALMENLSLHLENLAIEDYLYVKTAL